jgi:hypothetical protein
MRRLLLVPVMALIVMSPTVAQADPDDLVVCDAPPQNAIVIGPDETKSPTVEAPQFDPLGSTYTEVLFQLDLYPATAVDTARVSSTLGWELGANDWDLLLLDEDGTRLATSERNQSGPLGATPSESVSEALLHCSLFKISIENDLAIAVDDVDPLGLEVEAGAVTINASWL